MRTLFLVLWGIPVLAFPARGDIEIYVNGHKYDSLQQYLASERSPAPPSLIKAPLDSQQQDYIREQAQHLGIKVDFRKVKTLLVGRSQPSADPLRKLYVLSVEDGVAGALKDFYEGSGQPEPGMPSTVSQYQLQEAIARAVTSSKGPTLLISEPGKLRIMSLTPEDKPK